MDSDVLRDAEQLIVHLRHIRIDVEGYARRCLAKLGSNLSQYAVLAILDEQGEMTMGGLARHLGTTMGAVTNLVDKLVNAGRADRVRSEEDRRVVRVSILPPGRELVARVTRDTAEFLAGYLAVIPPEHRRIANDVCGRLVDAMRPGTAGSGRVSV